MQQNSRTRLIVYGVVFAALIGLMVASVFMFRGNDNNNNVFGGDFEFSQIQVEVSVTYTYEYYDAGYSLNTETDYFLIIFGTEGAINEATFRAEVTRSINLTLGADKELQDDFVVAEQVALIDFLNTERGNRDEYVVSFDTRQVRYENLFTTGTANRRQIVTGNFRLQHNVSGNITKRGFFTLVDNRNTSPAPDPIYRNIMFQSVVTTNLVPGDSYLLSADETSRLSTCRERIIVTLPQTIGSTSFNVSLVFAG